MDEKIKNRFSLTLKMLPPLLIVGLIVFIVWRLRMVTDAPNLLGNAEFKNDELVAWEFAGTPDTQIRLEPSVTDPESNVAVMRIPDSTTRSWGGLSQRVNVASGKPYQIAVTFRSKNDPENLTRIILRVSQFGGEGQLLDMDDISLPVKADFDSVDNASQQGWRLFTHNVATTEKTTAMEIGFGLMGSRATIVEADNFELRLVPSWLEIVRREKLVFWAIILLIATVGIGLGRLFQTNTNARKLFPKELFLSTAFTLGALLIIEVFLRLVFGLPKETFGFVTGGGLYAKNATLELVWGPIPYTVETNSLGFRDDEILLKKPKGVTRVAAMGDSVTDGFFVENENSYPHYLEQTLRSGGYAVEVLNAAKGGGSIGKEYAILREFVAPLTPDIVVLTFVTNDIEMNSKEEMISTSLWQKERPTPLEWLFTKTAIGELMFDVYLRTQSSFYRESRQTENKTQGEGRYQIAGGDDFATNVEIFNRRTRDSDGQVLNEPFSAEINAGIENYLYALEHMNNFSRDRDIQLVFVYFPSYSQVYDPETSLLIRDILRDASARLSIPFLDLTPKFREVGQHTVLHLAPIDFHPNPDGNRLMAETIADFLVEEQLLPASSGE